ncbi:MAG: extracellular solute-binding protein [Anaerolineaceae bacterium]
MSKATSRTQYRKRMPLLAWVLIGLILVNVTGCESLPFDWELPWVSQAPGGDTPTQAVASQTSQPTDLGIETTPVPEPEELTIWLPAELSPQGEDQAAVLLQSRLDAFAEAQDLEIQVRVKNLSGAGGLLDALTATNAAATEALPDLIVLNRKDLETAALKSLVYPLDELTTIVDGEDWFPYARNLSLIQNVVYGIPFVGDPLALVYDARLDLIPSSDWAGIASNAGVLIFAADDPQAAFPLTLYMAQGGLVEDTQRHPILEEEPLTDTLTLLRAANSAGHIYQLSLEYQDSSKVWEAFETGQANMAVAPISQVLQALKQEPGTQPIPTVVEMPVTTASGWVWAVTTPQPERQKLAVALAENLVEPGFLSGWTESLGRLPARPSALDAWQDEALKITLGKISSTAVVYPSNEVLTSIAPVLRNATLLVLRDNASLEETAKQAVESLK